MKKNKIIVIIIFVLLIIWILTYIFIINPKIIKDRNSQRLKDVSALRWWVEQYYQDNYIYPNKLSEIKSYLEDNIPIDPLEWKTINWCKFWYQYSVKTDINWIENWAYKISTCLEKTSTTDLWTKDDWWADSWKYEVGFGYYSF